MIQKVKYEEMLPHELDEAVAKFPVAYCSFGSLEWHGRHLPLGNDTLKAYGILHLCAEKHGGVVLPPTYWGIVGKWKPWTFGNFGEDLIGSLYTEIFKSLVDVGFKVIIGVTGHDVAPQKACIQRAVDTIESGGTARGFAMMEGDLYDIEGDVMDHAGHWETSLLMYLRPELVEMSRIDGEDLATDEGRKEAGIHGRDPRTDASESLGEKIANRIADNVAQKARELLASL